MRGGKTTLWRGGFFFCRFIGLERRVHHDNVLCALARCFSSGLRYTDIAISYPAFADGRAMAVAETGGKFRRQRIILLVTAKPKEENNS